MSDSAPRSNDRVSLLSKSIRAFIWFRGATECLPGYTFVGDLSDGGIGLYADRWLAPEAPIRVALESESAKAYGARVIWCSRFAEVKSFDGLDLPLHRLGVQILFGSEEERQEFLLYLETLKSENHG